MTARATMRSGSRARSPRIHRPAGASVGRRGPRVQIRRAYEPPHAGDGYRVLVDRLWPRGRSKASVRVAVWAKELAPSTALRTWFGHNPARWAEFKRRYLVELRSPERLQRLDELTKRAQAGTVTLVYGARDEEHNEARVLAEKLERRIRIVRRTGS
jgi:uncharacterized protein YeaO (DUF488 family)